MSSPPDHSTIKERKEAFVSGLTGGTVMEVYICTFIAISSYAMWCILQSRLGFFTNKAASKTTESDKHDKKDKHNKQDKNAKPANDAKKSGSSQAPFFSLATLVDIALNWLTMLLSITVYSSQPGLLNLFVLIPAVLVWISNKPDESLLSLNRQDNSDTQGLSEASKTKSSTSSSAFSLVKQYLPRQSFLTVYRGQMMIITCLAILAVDFPIFPRRFAKVETWGTSMMDLGVGSFVFSMGLVSSRSTLISFFDTNNGKASRPPFITALVKSFRHALSVLLLGGLRLCFVKSLEYQEHVTEYGIHWNFFMTLGLLPPIVTVLDYAFPARRASSKFITKPLDPKIQKKQQQQPFSIVSFVKNAVYKIVKLPISIVSLFSGLIRNGVPTCVLAFFIASGYEFSLDNLGLAAWIITAPRVDVISQNKEGICSFIGYLAIFLFGKSTGYYTLPDAVSSNQLLYPQTKEEYYDTLKNISSSSTLSSQSSSASRTGLEKKSISRKRKIMYLLFSSFVLHALYFFCRSGLRLIVSRRFANLPYVLWVSSYNTLNLAFFLFIEYIAFGGSPDSYPYEVRVPASVDAVNASGLFIFLLANVSTGLVNMSVNTLDASPQKSMLVLAAYATVLYLVGMVLKKKGITIRL